jgi:hypothetical protein
MKYVLSILGIIASFYMIYYREKVGDMLGEAEWMRKVGGVYMIVVLIAVAIFFWSIAELTGTTNILFAPLRYMIPGLREPMDAPDF